ncbi:YgfZ/GcvT domain-containing protein [Shimia ponticola]|uniref:CAF17-like 4Fe-4S cluster assembly/insertion protein YgfZ n=1 Tax=Shimia ponticola TaxID=2582893 RepID=UPI0011BDC21C|nr:folate-binding protein YgfZ [Shimia ponticola]
MPRRLIRVSGADHVSFLQGLITNDMAKLADGLVYAAILTPQGKYLADFFVVPDGDGVLIDVDAGLADGLAQRLMMYKLRADVALDWDERKVAQGVGEAPAGAFADPRHPSLGWRAYGDEDLALEDWDARRVAAIVPEFGAELGPDSYILEMGFERLNGVDFKKGCYVGQEVTARMKHKTELRKGLAKVSIEGHAEAGTPITVGDKEAGTLHSVVGNEGLAYVRFDRMTEAAQADGTPVTVLER